MVQDRTEKSQFLGKTGIKKHSYPNKLVGLYIFYHNHPTSPWPDHFHLHPSHRPSQSEMNPAVALSQEVRHRADICKKII